MGWQSCPAAPSPSPRMRVTAVAVAVPLAPSNVSPGFRGLPQSPSERGEAVDISANTRLLVFDPPEGPLSGAGREIAGAMRLDLQRELAAANRQLPINFITAHGDIPLSVQAMKGAVPSSSFRSRSVIRNPWMLFGSASLVIVPAGKRVDRTQGALRVPKSRGA